MMKHVKALAIKFVACLVLLYIILGMVYGMTFGDVFMISLILGIASYIIGDLLILPRTNNTIATIADFGLAYIVIWLMSDNLTYLDGDNLFTMSLISSLGVALFEYFFHKYVSNNITNETKSDHKQPKNLQYQTEVSEEIAPNRVNHKNENGNKTTNE
jgi:hypothetical protein